jgi:hypothetical protein
MVTFFFARLETASGRFFFLNCRFGLQSETLRTVDNFSIFLGVIFSGHDPRSGSRHRQNMHICRKSFRDRFWMLRIPKRQESTEKIIPTHIVIEKSASKEKHPFFLARIFFHHMYIHHMRCCVHVRDLKTVRIEHKHFFWVI